MSWLTDLAGKAENLLNKIDQNAAVVLKDKNVVNEQLQDVMWQAPSVWTAEQEPSNPSSGQIAMPSPLLRSAPSGAASPVRRPSPSRCDTTFPNRNDDDNFLRFLNGSESVLPATEELRGSPSGASVQSVGSSSPVPSRSHSRNPSQGGMSSMSSSFVSTGNDEYQQGFMLVKNIESNIQADINQSSLENVLAENNLLKTEVRCLNNELAMLLQRIKAAEKEVSVAGQELHTLRGTLAQNEMQGKQLQMLQSRLTESENSISFLTAENERLKEGNATRNSSLDKELSTHSERVKLLELEHESLIQESNELRQQVLRLQASLSDAVKQNERYRLEVTGVTTEAEQYRARATRVLQDKEKLIASLQADWQSDGHGDSSVFDQEIEQLRKEVELLHQESASQSKQLQSVRNDLHMCELQQEEHRQKAESEIDRLQKKVQDERARRQTAEEDCRIHLEELKTSKSDMNHQHEYLKTCLKAKEDEISQLKRQQAQVSSHTSLSSNDTTELEARVRNLATILIQKQGALEALIAERNSLRLKLERTEKQSTAAPGVQISMGNGGTVLNVNESDSGTRLRVPTLLSESPGDTVVTRRVKIAYSSLDTLGIRIGAFLRRYPLARILVIIYMVLLHLWVALVLFSYSPEGYSNGAIRSPPSVTPEEPKGV